MKGTVYMEIELFTSGEGRENFTRSDDYYCLAFDPGETTGVALIPKNGQDIKTWQIASPPSVKKDHKGVDALIEFLFTKNDFKGAPTLVICEEFRMDAIAARAMINSTHPTIQCVGIIRAYAAVVGAEYICSPRGNKTVGAAWSKVSPPKGNHAGSHWIDALNHGIYAMVTRGILKADR